MKAGNLRHRIELQASTPTADGQGGTTDAWATITDGTVWASVEPMRAYEQAMHEQLQHTVSHKVTVRYRSGLTSKMRVKFGSRIFRVVGIRNPEERNVTLVLECEEVGASVVS